MGLYLQSRIVLLPRLCALDVCWPRLGLFAFDVNRTGFAALLYAGLYVQSRILHQQGLCAHDVFKPNQGFCAFAVN